jgi:hypothetical protein
MKIKHDVVDSLPPMPYRIRVVDGDFWSSNEFLIKSTFDSAHREIGVSNASIQLANSWSNVLADLAKKEKLPQSSEPLSILAEIGIALSIIEERLKGVGTESVEYLIHSCMAVLSMHNNKNQQLLNALAIDGGYYLQKTKSSVDALAESIERSL